MSKTIRKTVLIGGDLNSEQNIKTEFNTIYFNPDELKVRQLAYTDLSGTKDFVNIQLSLVDYQTIGAINEGQHYEPNTTISINRPITGQQEFRFLDANGQPKDLTGFFAAVIEFAKRT